MKKLLVAALCLTPILALGQSDKDEPLYFDDCNGKSFEIIVPAPALDQEEMRCRMYGIKSTLVYVGGGLTKPVGELTKREIEIVKQRSIEQHNSKVLFALGIRMQELASTN